MKTTSGSRSVLQTTPHKDSITKIQDALAREVAALRTYYGLV